MNNGIVDRPCLLRLHLDLLQITEEIRSKLLVDLEEDIFQVRHRDAIRQYVILTKSLVKDLEEGAKVCSLRLMNDICDFFVTFIFLMSFLKVGQYEFLEARVRLLPLLDEGDLVAKTEAIFEEE